MPSEVSRVLEAAVEICAPSIAYVFSVSLAAVSCSISQIALVLLVVELIEFSKCECIFTLSPPARRR